MMKYFMALLAITISAMINAQNLYPKKVNDCPVTKFCLDCGDSKAGVKKKKFEKLIAELEATNYLRGIKGRIKMQIIVDSTGKGCVLSHTDTSDNIISQNIVAALNSFDGFIPAKTAGKAEPRASINMSFDIKDGTLSGKVERVDIDALFKAPDKPVSPEISNRNHVYKNDNLKNYKISVWNTRNSNFTNHRNNDITIDQNGLVWLTTDVGLFKFDGKEFIYAEQNITEKVKYDRYTALETDNENTKWVNLGRSIYSYDDEKWTMYDSKLSGMDGAHKIINQPRTGEVFFISDSGLIIYKNGNWTRINKNKLKELPTDSLRFAKRDSRNSIWIGTVGGTVMINENGEVTKFNDTASLLKGKCITSMDEDVDGNLYFGVFDLDNMTQTQAKRKEGLLVRYANGTMKQFTASDSGMPFNGTTCVLYDKNENILWISTYKAGLVRYDLKDGWENYHSQNSEIPTSEILGMAFDSNGALFLTTGQGLVRIERKER